MKLATTKEIAQFIHLMSEGINGYQVKCNDVIISLKPSEHSSVDVETRTIYMSKTDAVCRGYNYFKFFYRVSEILVHLNALKMTPEIHRCIEIAYSGNVLPDIVTRNKLAYEMLRYGYAYKMQEYSGDLKVFIPDKVVPDVSDESYNEIKEYNYQMSIIRKYLSELEKMSDERSRELQKKLAKDNSRLTLSEIRSKFKTDDTEEPALQVKTTNVDELTKSLHIKPIQSSKYTARARHLANVLESCKTESFFKSYKVTVVDSKTVVTEDGELPVSELKDVRYPVKQSFIDDVKSKYVEYPKYINKYIDLIMSSIDLAKINLYKNMIEKICYYGIITEKRTTPLSLSPEIIKELEDSLIDFSVEKNIANTLRNSKTVYKTAKEWNKERSSK